MSELLIEGINLVLLLSLIPIVVVGVAGGVVALFQAATQVQEASLVHLFRLAAFAAVVLFFGEFGYRLVENLLVRCFEVAAEL